MVTCPGTVLSAWLSVGFSCCGVLLNSFLSPMLCGLFGLCRWAVQGWRTAPVYAGLGTWLMFTIPNSVGSSVVL